MIYIAIVAKDIEQGHKSVNRSAFTSDDKDTVIQAALTARDEWKSRGNGPYKIYIGTITTEIITPVVVNYKEVRI